MSLENLTRRSFLEFSAVLGTGMFYPSLLAQEEDKWEKARKDEKLRQKIIDDEVKSSKELSQVVKRVYTVYVVEKKGAKNDWDLVWGDKQLKFYDSSAEAEFKKLMREYAKKSAADLKDLKDATDKKMYEEFVAQILDFAEKSDVVDAWLHPSLWGNVLPVGFASQKFWEAKQYETSADRCSRLKTYLPIRARDMKENPTVGDLKIDFGEKQVHVNRIIPYKAEGVSDVKAVLVSRYWLAEANSILENKSSETYQKWFSDEWQKSPDFRELIRLRNIDIRMGVKDDKLVKLGFSCLPWEGRIVKYDPELVKKYKFEEKK